MKYICVWRDICGFVHPLAFEAENDAEAISGLIERCDKETALAEGVTVDDRPLSLPHIVIREDMSSFYVNYELHERTRRPFLRVVRSGDDLKKEGKEI